MPSGTEPRTGLRLQPRARIERPLSLIEYYHASVGSSGRTIQHLRHVILVVEGEGPEFVHQVWRDALDRVCAENPACNIRVVGRGCRARWVCDGPPARLRIVEHTDWDGMSGSGAEFISAEPMSLEHGPSVELILVSSSPRGRLVILRTPHAVMDGRGGLHFLEELFRALRGEALLGSNAGFSDVELMRKVGPRRWPSRYVRTDFLTGVPRGGEPGDEWRRIQLPTNGRNIVARVAAIAAEFMHRHSDRPALIAVPVDLRRYVDGLTSTANFTNIVLVPLSKGEGEVAFRRRFNAMIRGRMDAYFPRALILLKLLSPSWMDRFLSRTPENYRNGKAKETVVITHLGRVDAEAMSCDSFRMQGFFGLPALGISFFGIVFAGNRAELIVGLPRGLSSNGRLDEFLAYFCRRMEESGTRLTKDHHDEPAVP